MKDHGWVNAPRCDVGFAHDYLAHDVARAATYARQPPYSVISR